MFRYYGRNQFELKEYFDNFLSFHKSALKKAIDNISDEEIHLMLSKIYLCSSHYFMDQQHYDQALDFVSKCQILCMDIKSSSYYSEVNKYNNTLIVLLSNTIHIFFILVAGPYYCCFNATSSQSNI